MNIENKYKLKTQKLEQAKKQISELQAELDKNRNSSIKINILISDLESMKKEWESMIEDLRKKQTEYSVLIKQLRTLSKGIKQ